MERKKEEVLIPAGIFNRKLGSLESIVKYLKESGYKYSEIAFLLNRDQRTVWNVYKKANEKHPGTFEFEESKIKLPVSILEDRKFSVLESISLFLKKENFSLNEIGMILNRSNKTVWTVCKRAERKSMMKT